MYGTPKKQRIGISFNAPVILGFAAVCVIAQILNIVTGGASNRAVFSVYGASLLDPLTWVRCIGHVFGHAGWDHLFGNLMYILILGPMIEEKYGAKNTAIIILVTAAVTGIVSMIFFPRVMLLGASGVVFAFILIGSITAKEDHKIPVTFILVALLYLGQQIWQGLFSQDNVSQMAHIAGGAVGAVLGFLLGKTKQKRSSC